MHESVGLMKMLDEVNQMVKVTKVSYKTKPRSRSTVFNPVCHAPLQGQSGVITALQKISVELTFDIPC